MAPAPEPAVGRRLSVTLFIAALAVGLAAVFWIPLQAPTPGSFSDSVDYLVFADTLRSMLQGRHTPETDWFFLYTRYPPLYPLLLTAAGAGIADPSPAFWLGSALLVLAWLLAAAAFVREAVTTAGFLLAVPLVLNPGWLLAALEPLSEPLFLCLLLGAMLLAQRVRTQRRGLLVFVLVVSLAPLCRSAGFTLVLASGLWLAWTRPAPPARVLGAVLLMALPGALWTLLRANYPVIVAYSGDLAKSLMSVEAWRYVLAEQPSRMVAAVIGSMDPWASGWRSPVLALAPLFLGGLLLRLRERQLDALFVLIYGGLVAVWPYPAELSRLLLVLLPMILLYSWHALAWLGKRRLDVPAAGLVAAVTIVAIPVLLNAAERIAAPVESALESSKRDRHYLLARSEAAAARRLETRVRIDSAMSATANAIPPGECVFTFYPQALYAHAPSVTALTMPYPRDPAMPLREQFAPCRYFFVTGTPSIQYREPALYPLPEAGSISRPVFASFVDDADGPLMAAALFRFDD